MHKNISYKERIQKAYKELLKREKNIRTLIDNKKHDKIINEFNKIFDSSLDFAFEVGFNGNKYELILSPEGISYRLFELEYFKEHIPEKFLENWDVIIGRTPTKNISIKMFDNLISADDILVYPTVNDQKLDLSVYSEKLISLLNNSENDAYTLFFILLDNTVGEIAVIKYINEVNILKNDNLKDKIQLTDLKEYIKNTFKLDEKNLQDYKTITESYLGYKIQNVKEEISEANRDDIYVGFSCFNSLLNNYFNNDNYIIEDYSKKGIFVGYIAFNVSISEDALKLRDTLEEKINENLGSENIKFIGGASGSTYSYLDFIAWDLNSLLKSINKICKELSIPNVVIHSFNKTDEYIFN